MIRDSHCHISCHPRLENVTDLLQQLHSQPYAFNVMTTNPWDIEYLKAAVDLDSELAITPFLGIHPWYSHLFSAATGTKEEHYGLVLTDLSLELLEVLPEPIPLHTHLQRLRLLAAHLQERNKKFGIGEIGLDKLFRIPSSGYFGCPDYKGDVVLTKSKVRIEHQMFVLCKLLDLANELKVPVSLHCVKAHGPLYDTLKNGFLSIPEICLHSYSGSLDQAHRWINDFKRQERQLSFSVSSFVNGKPEKVADLKALLSVLDDRQILVESDFPIDEYYLGGKGAEHQLAMEAIQKMVCEYKGWQVEYGKEQLQRNSREFTNV